MTPTTPPPLGGGPDSRIAELEHQLRIARHNERHHRDRADALDVNFTRWQRDHARHWRAVHDLCNVQRKSVPMDDLLRALDMLNEPWPDDTGDDPMANQPHPDKEAVTWRLHRALLTRVRAAAAERGEAVVAFVTRALTRELDGLQGPVFVRVRDGETASTGSLGEGCVVTHRDSAGHLIAVEIPNALGSLPTDYQ